jgi:uncharacterized protein (TIGR02246 family)
MTNSPAALAISAGDEQAIRTLIQLASDAQNDPDVLIPLHTPGAAVVNFFGRRILGRDAFAQAMQAALSSPLRDVTTTVKIVDLRPISDGVVLVSCVKTVHDGRAGAEDDLPASAGALTYVVTGADESWQIALAQTTPIRT